MNRTIIQYVLREEQRNTIEKKEEKQLRWKEKKRKREIERNNWWCLLFANGYYKPVLKRQTNVQSIIFLERKSLLKS